MSGFFWNFIWREATSRCSVSGIEMGLNSYVYVYTFSARDGKIFLIGMNLSKKEKKMKEYVKPLAELQEFTVCDVITTSRGPIETPDL